jgi:hypothetical protein
VWAPADSEGIIKADELGEKAFPDPLPEAPKVEVDEIEKPEAGEGVLVGDKTSGPERDRACDATRCVFALPVLMGARAEPHVRLMASGITAGFAGALRDAGAGVIFALGLGGGLRTACNRLRFGEEERCPVMDSLSGSARRVRVVVVFGIACTIAVGSDSPGSC